MSGPPWGTHPSRPSWGTPSAVWGEAFCPRKGNKTGMGQAERGRERGVFLFDVTQAESESAHVNELENAIKNIYILGTVIQNSL